MLGHTEIIIVAAVVLVLFGSTAIPKFFRALGKARKEFEKGADEAVALDGMVNNEQSSKATE